VSPAWANTLGVMDFRSTWVAWYRDSYGGGKRVPGCGKGKCNTLGTRQRANNTACAGTAARYLHQHRPPMQRPVPSPAPQPSSDKLESNSRIRSKAAYQEPRLPCWVGVRSAQVPRQGGISSREIQREAAAGAEKKHPRCQPNLFCVLCVLWLTQYRYLYR